MTIARRVTMVVALLFTVLAAPAAGVVGSSSAAEVDVNVRVGGSHTGAIVGGVIGAIAL
ncbi:hypothetical protein [Amycolatopsis sp. NPDC054798]